MSYKSDTGSFKTTYLHLQGLDMYPCNHALQIRNLWSYNKIYSLKFSPYMATLSIHQCHKLINKLVLYDTVEDNKFHCFWNYEHYFRKCK